MKYFSNYFRKFCLPFIIILTVLGALLLTKELVTKNKFLTRDYQLLVSIPPEDIIHYQKNKPAAWQDFVALKRAVETTAKEKEDKKNILNTLEYQLDQNIEFKKLNWQGIDNEIRKTAFYYRKIIYKYPLYDHKKYAFPLQASCYFIDTYGADREGGKRRHEGTDLFDKKGTRIFSVCSGYVERLGWNRLGGDRVGIRGLDGNYYYYAHLDEINKELQIGQKIEKGDFIGTMGNTGAITTPDHLHFGIELPNGEWVNPYPFLKVWESHLNTD
ncbi:MAG: M23 family metallopeptidase [Desulfitobacteriia bacterium]|jgi:murein DD-endopeptidase MepM/ murein hydrolase activator NlpD